jgi:hypothetical protein
MDWGTIIGVISLGALIGLIINVVVLLKLR